MANDEKPHPGDLLTYAFEVMSARGGDYDNKGGIEDNYLEMAAVASIVTGKNLSARDIAVVLHCVKLVRSKSNPLKIDNYLDGINYWAFACFLTGLPPRGQPSKQTSGNEAQAPVLKP
jgi:hypothetical protein